MEQILFEAMTKAIQVANEKELEYMIAKEEEEKLIAAYRAYKKENGK